MLSGPDGVEFLNSYALVSYISEPLSTFLDELRCELVPNCFLRAHVTILPPRPLQYPAETAEEQLRETAYILDPFEIELSGIEIFPQTDVIYVAIGKGQEELKRMHGAFNAGPAAYQEPFEYHPHITLAQNLTPDQVDELSRVAKRRLVEYAGTRTFRVETLHFVQNTRWNGWVDLAELTLGRLVAA